MLNNPPFYNKTIKNITSAFGSLFNDISIIRDVNGQQQEVKVPLVYASADKAFSRKTEDPTLNFGMQQIFPRLGFYLIGFTYDPMRRVAQKTFAQKFADKVFAPAPYNLDFEVYLATASIEDGLQISEQILPFFNPEFTILTNSFPSLNLKQDVPIVLNSVSYTDPAADSEYSDFRIIEWTFSFTAKTYLFGPSKTNGVIKHANIFLFDDKPYSTETQKTEIDIDVVPDTANETDPHTIETVIR